NSDGVNIRTGAGTGFEIVTQVFIGDQLRITGESEEGDDFVWWPVELVDDTSITGYIAEDFIDLVIEE
ncbi:MAG: SH3 domain-containing protein, partial [Thermomicrobiales bacterium]|nr:SH3 domain-containing protein [Thermomicrobiales bacterium]